MLRKIFIVCLSLLYFWPALNYSQKARLPILPYPKMIQMQEDFFILDTTITLHFGKSDTTHLSIGIGELTEILTDIAGKKYTTNNAASQVIQFGFPERERKLKRLLTNMKIWPEARISDEGYILLIQPKRIFIVANQPPGIYYGIQTLKQLLQNLPASKKLACMTIIDWPDFKYRGIMDDISRGPVPTLDFMKQQIRRFASLKLNMLTYYTENVVRTQKHSDFAPTGGGISIDEWGELAKYADRYHIQLVGNFQSFGHFEKILAYPQYAHLGEAGRMLTPTREESYQFISDIYGEMTPAFTSPFFHVNCDETWDLGRLESRKMVDSLGLAGVYALHLNRLHRILKKLNKKMLCWADIALAHPKVLEAIPRDIILLSWNYSALNSFDEMLEPLHKAGFMTFVCPGVLNSNRIWPDYQVARQNIFNFIRDGKKFMSAGV
ncbi:beta-N-acetylhexosaminidase, partial [candidate division KSB1 bacterium]|nr:beta-N-acetylhexosaminidase [candidate division KSB1 bacterium]